MSKKNKHTKNAVQKNIFLSLSDLDKKIMLILTLLFLFIVFINIGNTYAPKTVETFTASGNHDLIVDFGDYITVDHMDIFLGNLENRNVALSAFNENTREWEVFSESTPIVSVFAWNTIPLNYYLRYLGIVFLDETANVNEIVFYDSNGNVINPINVNDYPALYDEQEMHPEDVTFLSGTMFDEIYHGRTAYEILHQLPIYETTHPHLGKILISIGIALFGMNPFGWRFMVALLGTIMVPIIYIFALRISKKTFIATGTTLLLIFDFMHFALSRISTIDIPVALFILLMYFFMYSYLEQPDKNNNYAYKLLILSGICMSLGVATKFTGIYAGAGLGIIFIGYHLKFFPKENWKKLLGLCVTFFMIVPFIIYTLAFIPIVETYPHSNIFAKMFEGTKYMIDYHANQTATHYYSSPWYSWLYDGKPLLLAHDAVGADKVSSISVMGNPIIFWAIIPCVLYMIFRIFKNKDGKALFLTISYLAQYVPWIPITRCLFIYHYFAASLFGILIIGYTFNIIFEKYPKAKPMIITYIAIAAIMFIIFYPAISGMPVSQEYLLKLKWLPDWVITY